MDLFNDFYTTVLFLLEGLGVTVSVTVIALAVGFGLGVLMAVLRVYGSRPLSAFAAGYSVVVRAVPVVVTIFILYFVIAQIVDLSPFLAGSLPLGFASGAYQSEIFRGALKSVTPGDCPGGGLTSERDRGMSTTVGGASGGPPRSTLGRGGAKAGTACSARGGSTQPCPAGAAAGGDENDGAGDGGFAGADRGLGGGGADGVNGVL